MKDTRKPLRSDQHYCVCGAKIPLQYAQCYSCYSSQPQRITHYGAMPSHKNSPLEEAIAKYSKADRESYREGFASEKDWSNQ